MRAGNRDHPDARRGALLLEGDLALGHAAHVHQRGAHRRLHDPVLQGQRPDRAGAEEERVGRLDLS
jgi:hypothetical protein